MRFAWIVAAAVLALAGNVFVIVAIYNERRMQRHRQPGVSYAQATFRRDGGWRRADLFTPEGLTYQRRAARFGVIAVSLWILAMGAWLGAALSQP
jgi:hypothetical protein